MPGIGVVEVVAIGLIAIMLLALLLLVIYSGRKGGNIPSAEETRLVQELMRGLKMLEARMDSMESILLESQGRK